MTVVTAMPVVKAKLRAKITKIAFIIISRTMVTFAQNQRGVL